MLTSLLPLLLMTASAQAQDAAVLPFMAWGVDEQAAANLSAQIAQEIDFLATYDNVFPLDVPPPGMNAACLADPACMQGVADTVETQIVVAGQVSGTAEQYDVFTVLFDAGTGQFVRQHRFQITPAAIGDEIAGQARFLITGEAPSAASSAVTSSDDFLEDDDDFSFEEGPTTPAYDDYDDYDDAIDIPATTMDLSEFDDEPVRERTQPVEREPAVVDRYDDPYEDDRYDDPAPIRGPDPKENLDKPRLDSTVAITARVGYARYQTLNMVTWGGEFSIDALKPARINIGLEMQSMPLPIEGTENEFGVPQVEWRSVMPFNIGAAYVFYTDTLTPYIGLDLTLTAYTRQFDTAPGVRMRGGFDYMVSETFGVNVNVAAGAWFGTNTENKDISVELNGSGFAPQFSLGTVLAF